VHAIKVVDLEPRSGQAQPRSERENINGLEREKERALELCTEESNLCKLVGGQENSNCIATLLA